MKLQIHWVVRQWRTPISKRNTAEKVPVHGKRCPLYLLPYYCMARIATSRHSIFYFAHNSSTLFALTRSQFHPLSYPWTYYSSWKQSHIYGEWLAEVLKVATFASVLLSGKKTRMGQKARMCRSNCRWGIPIGVPGRSMYTLYLVQV